MAKHEQLPYIENRLAPGRSDRAVISYSSETTGFQGQNHHGLRRREERVYKFQDTSEGTLARFIEWSYTGDYPDVITATHPLGRKSGKEEIATINVEEGHTLTAAGTSFTSDNHPLLAHICLYIFCSIYHISKLQKLAFEKVTARFSDLEALDSLDTQLAVVAALRLSFRKLSTQDPLLDWMAQYAAYYVGKLQWQTGFHELLRESPTLSTRIVLFLNPASSPPWKTPKSKHVYARYSPDQSYEDGYE
ncbi:hypothetical protein GB937_010198 [Aspergillus fischeri]|nr:hypothetical protein GB937_010198 [Aspergillus fischeri]